MIGKILCECVTSKLYDIRLLSVQIFHCYLNAELGAVGEIMLSCLRFIMFLILVKAITGTVVNLMSAKFMTS